MRGKSKFVPYLLIVLGIYFLLSKLHLIPELLPKLLEWWPVVLIVIGVMMLLRRATRSDS